MTIDKTIIAFNKNILEGHIRPNLC